MTGRTYSSGQAARQAGTSRKALRVYESKGLLPETQRNAAGYRLYTEADIATLRFIRRAKTLGLSLDEIGDILALRRSGTAPCRHVVALVEQRIREVDRTIAELRDLRRSLVTTREDAWEHPSDDGQVCGIIEHTAASVPDRGRRPWN